MDAIKTADKPRAARITTGDVLSSLRSGASDFGRAPVFGLVLGGVFAFIGVLIYVQLLVWNSTYWMLPIAVGFPLVGPFLAVGLYEVSRELEAGRKPDWVSVLNVVFEERKRQLPLMVFVSLFFYLIWVYMAHLIFALFFGLKPLTNVSSSLDLFFTSHGVMMLLTGTIVGGIMAFLLFSISAVSIPLLLEKDVDFVTAMIASFTVVLENKGPMLIWGLIVAALSFLAILPIFLGMFVVFPILGHATWHLYRKAVEFEPHQT